MVQKKKNRPSATRKAEADPAAAPEKRRGRPRAFEPEVALKHALETFRQTGYSATSVDDLSTAMGINRPSLYGTFGGKRELFLKAYQRYRSEFAALFVPAFDPELTLRQMLEHAFAIAIAFYLSGEKGPAGCFTTMTAGSEAMADPEIRATVQKAIAGADRLFAERFRLAVAAGELPASANCDVLARLTAAAMQSISIRARARAPRSELEELASGAVDLIVGAHPAL